MTRRGAADLSVTPHQRRLACRAHRFTAALAVVWVTAYDDCACAQDAVVSGSPARAWPMRARPNIEPRAWSLWGGFLSHELSNPGVHVGVEYALETTRHFQTLAAASLQMYSQPDTETAWFLQARWGHRYTSGFGVTFDQFLGVGAQYTRYDVRVFEFDGQRGVARSEPEDVLGF